jgi:hypothetical protein
VVYTYINQGLSHEHGQLLLLIEQPLHLAPQLPLNLSLTTAHSSVTKIPCAIKRDRVPIRHSFLYSLFRSPMDAGKGPLNGEATAESDFTAR